MVSVSLDIESEFHHGRLLEEPRKRVADGAVGTSRRIVGKESTLVFSRGLMR